MLCLYGSMCGNEEALFSHCSIYLLHLHIEELKVDTGVAQILVVDQRHNLLLFYLFSLSYPYLRCMEKIISYGVAEASITILFV